MDYVQNITRKYNNTYIVNYEGINGEIYIVLVPQNNN